MGQCYSVTLKLSFKDREGATKALRRKIERGKEKHINYSLEHYKEIGIDTKILEDLLKIFFGGWEGKLTLDDPTPNIFHSGFDASYGWENVMMAAFEELSPFLEDQSSITIYPDSGADKAIVKKQRAIWK